MARTGSSTVLLGGIGAMLEEAETCPNCRQVSSRGHVGRHTVGSPLPAPAYPAIPLLEPVAPEAEEVPRLPAARQIRAAEAAPRPSGSRSERSSGLFGRSGTDRGALHLRALWLPPPDLGEVF